LEHAMKHKRPFDTHATAQREAALIWKMIDALYALKKQLPKLDQAERATEVA
jgi:hypothetical protein